MISIDEVRSYPEQWDNTSHYRLDGKTEYREKIEFGNRHAVFEIDSSWGEFHVDQYNATDFPYGSINHASKWVEEKTGIPKDIVTVLGIIAAVYVGYKTLK
jgi:hypothetical protein